MPSTAWCGSGPPRNRACCRKAEASGKAAARTAGPDSKQPSFPRNDQPQEVLGREPEVVVPAPLHRIVGIGEVKLGLILEVGRRHADLGDEAGFAVEVDRAPF